MAKNTHDFKPIEGKYVNLREVTIDDAAFILQLRTTGKAVNFFIKQKIIYKSKLIISNDI